MTTLRSEFAPKRGPRPKRRVPALVLALLAASLTGFAGLAVTNHHTPGDMWRAMAPASLERAVAKATGETASPVEDATSAPKPTASLDSGPKTTTSGSDSKSRPKTASTPTPTPTPTSTSTPPTTSSPPCAVGGLQTLVNGTRDGGVLDLGGRCFVENQTVVIQGRHDLTVQNGSVQATTTGAELPAYDGKESNWPRHRKHVLVAGSSGIVLRNLSVQSINTAATFSVDLEAQSGFVVDDRSSNVLIEDVSVRDVYGDCVAVKGTGVTVRRATCVGIGRQGMSVTDGGNILVEDSRIERVGRSGFDIEPLAGGGEEVHGVTIRNTTFVAPIKNVVLGWSGSGAITDVVFEHNRLVGVPFRVKAGGFDPTGAPKPGRSGFRFVGNSSDTAGAADTAAVAVAGAAGPIVVRDNVVPTNVTHDGTPGLWLSLDQTDGVVVAGNTTSGTIHLVSTTLWDGTWYALATLTGGSVGSSPGE